MAFYVVVAGETLYRMTVAGAATALTVPAGITLSASRPPRLAVLGRNVIITNNPLRSLLIDPDFVVRPMQLAKPTSPVLLSAGTVGTLTGGYKVKYTHIVKDAESGALLLESDFSPVSSTVALAGQTLAVAGIEPSPDAATTHHRMYRTLADGEVFFSWIDVDVDHTTVADDLTDILLPNLAAPRELGAGPGLAPATYMTLCVEWKNRLFAVGDTDIDTLRYSGEGIAYGWPATYGLDVKPVGGDEYGITGLMPRRDLLGVAKRKSFWKVSGGLTDDEGVPQFDVEREKDGKGCYGPSIVVDDTAYYLGPDGVYAWGPNGFDCPSDGKVRKWFATDDYFNRGRYPAAFVKYNERYDALEWHLAAAGSDAIDRWVSLDLKTGTWLGPHRTDKAMPTSGFMMIDSDGQALPVIGADDGVVYAQNAPGGSDDGAAIAVDLLSKWHDGNTPTIEKVWGAVALVSKTVPAIGNCRVTYRVGDLDAPVSQIVPADMRAGVNVLPRAGKGRFLQVQITESTNAADVDVYGYEVPYYELANRVRR